jgi:MFS family permease
MANLSIRIPPALRNRNFSLYWGGILVSMAGSQMQVWALYWHIRTLTDQPIALSIVGLVRFVPILVFSLWGGLIADRLNRRVILYFTQSIMALVAVILGVLTFLNVLQLWHIYVLLGINAAVNSFDIPARQSLVANMVPKGDLPSALSMQSVAIQVGAILGPALSGLLISSVGLTWVYWINSISFAAVILALVFMTPIPQEFVPAIRQGFSQLKQIGEGFRFVVKKPIILSGMVLEFWASFFSSANTLMPFLARDILHVGAVAYGWLSSAQAIGSVTAGLIVSQQKRVRRQGLVMLIAAGMFGLATVVFGASPSFWLTLAALILVGGAHTLSAIMRNTIRQILTPDQLRGRIVSISFIFIQGGPQLGEIESGLVAQWLTTPLSIVTGGIGCLIAVGIITLAWPQLRRYRGDEAYAN